MGWVYPDNPPLSQLKGMQVTTTATGMQFGSTRVRDSDQWSEPQGIWNLPAEYNSRSWNCVLNSHCETLKEWEDWAWSSLHCSLSINWKEKKNYKLMQLFTSPAFNHVIDRSSSLVDSSHYLHSNLTSTMIWYACDIPLSSCHNSRFCSRPAHIIMSTGTIPLPSALVQG